MAAQDPLIPVPLTDILNAAAEYERAGRLDEAGRLTDRILSVAPDHAESLHLSGLVAFRQGRKQEGADKLEKAIQHGTNPALYLRNICEMYRHLDRPDDALAAAQRAVALQPHDPLGLHNLAVVQYERGDLEACMAAAEAALRIRPDMAGAHFVRAEALLLQGRWAEGWEEYEWRFRVPDGVGMLPATDKPHWDGTPFHDGRLLLFGDQGFGDIIQFARYIPWAQERCPDIAVAASPQIVPVLTQLVPADRVFTRWQDCNDFKALMPLSGLPRLHGTRVDNVPAPIPYLHADPARVARWRARLDPLVRRGHKRIGIVWAGRPTHNNDRRRSVRLADFAPLAALPGISLIALQKGPAATEAGGYFGRAPLINIGAEIGDYDDTMALLECLDLVVTVDTSVAHLAAALGRPVWVLLPTAPDWRWLLGRSDTPWYPTVRLFRQADARQWAPVLHQVAAALR